MRESHVEMDGAWALYEAWTLLQEGELDTALVYSFGRSSPSQLDKALTLQLDPYYLAPLWPDPVALAALQAQALIDAGKATEADFAAMASRSRRDAMANPNAQVTGDRPVDELLADDYVVSPLRRHALPPISDGCAAIILAAGDRAREVCERPAWITGIDHRIETHQLGARDLTSSPSTTKAAQEAGLIGNGSGADAQVDVAELHAPFASQEIVLREALGLGDQVAVNPSGGALAANAVMVAGLTRIGEAAQRIIDGHARSAPWPTLLRARACSRTWSARWPLRRDPVHRRRTGEEPDGRALCRDRRRADPPRLGPHRRVHRRAGARGGDRARSRTRPWTGRTSTPS